MADNIISSLFGLSGQQVRQQQLLGDQQYASDLAGSVTTDPLLNYSREQTKLGATVGAGLVRGVAGLFGLQTGAEKRASAMEEALKVATQSLPPEQRRNRAAIMNKLSEVLGRNPNFQRESMDALFQANEFDLEDSATRAKITSSVAAEKSSQASADYYKVRTAQEQLDNKQKTLQVQGQIATGASQAYSNSKDPDARNRIWNNSIKAFEDLGVDTSTIKDLPESERQGYLEQIVGSSKTSLERIKEETNQVNAEYKQNRLEFDKVKLDRSLAFKEKQDAFSKSIRTAAYNLASDKYTTEQKKTLFSQANDLLKANERELDDIRKDVQDDIDERTKLEGGKQFGLSLEETNIRKQQLDARIKNGRANIKRAELILKQGREDLKNTRFNPTPSMESTPPLSNTPSSVTIMSDADAKKMLGSKYKPGYKFYVQDGRIKGEPK